MRLEHRRVLPVDRDQLWALLMDVPAMGSCVPGVTQVRPLGGDRYQGTLTARLGFFSVNVAVLLTVLSEERSRWHAAMRAEGNEPWLGGGLHAGFEVQLATMDPTTTDLVITADLADLGRLGQLGEPIIRAKAADIFEQFTANVERRLNGNAVRGRA